METKYTVMGLLISFVLVLALWVLQRFFRKMKILCFCSTVSLIVVVGSEVLIYHFPENDFLAGLGMVFLYLGFLVAGVFVKPLVSFDNLSPTYTILGFIFAVIFWSLAFWRIVNIIQYDRKKHFCRKTNGNR